MGKWVSARACKNYFSPHPQLQMGIVAVHGPECESFVFAVACGIVRRSVPTVTALQHVLHCDGMVGPRCNMTGG